MYLLLFSLLLGWILKAWFNLYWSIFVAVYFLYYIDGREFTGERRWDFFRRLRLWRLFSPMQYNFTNAKDLSLMNLNTKRLYVMLPGDTLVSLVWGIGLHGGNLPFAEKLHYVVPPLLMWIPLLRDVLLWSGAITYHPTKRPLNTVLLEMMQSGRSVCYCPSNFANMALLDNGDVEAGVIVCPAPTDEILSFALLEKIQIVPIVVHGEQKRYYILSLPRIQHFFYNYIGYPFPLIFFMRIFSKTLPPLLRIQFGSIIHCDHKYAAKEQLRESFESVIKGMTCSELGDNELKMM